MGVSKLSVFRNNIKQVVGGLDKDVKKIMSDKSLLKSDREDRAEYEKSRVYPKVQEQLSLMGQEYKSIKNAAQEKYNIFKRQDKSDMAARAAVLLPMIKNMSSDELLKLFQARAAERLDREIVNELITVKAQITGDDVLLDRLIMADNETVDLLPEKELEARRQLMEVDDMERYMSEAIKEASLLEAKLKGNLKSIEGTMLTTASYILDQLEQGKQFKPDSITPADPYQEVEVTQ